MATIEPYQTAAGRRFMVRYRKPDRTTTKKRGFRTKRDAEAYAASVEVSKLRGEFIDVSAGRMTIGEMGGEWLARQTHLKPSSYTSVEAALRNYVLPRWGACRVSDIRKTDVQSWLSSLTMGDPGAVPSRKPKSATVVARAYGVLASILDDAVDDRRLSINPARGVNLPRKRKKPHVYLSHEQVHLLASKSKYGTLVFVLAYCGLRWGEAVALRVRHVDALRRRLRVEENAVEVGGKIFVGTPKTHELRTVPYPKFLASDIAQLCEGKHRDDLLFGTGCDYLRAPKVHGNGSWLDAALTRAELPRLTPHDLRHTAASLAVSAGANVKAVQRMLGHASAAMTLDVYADLFDEDLDSVSEALDDAISRAIVPKACPEAG